MHLEDSKENIADRLLWPGESRERFFALYSKYTIDYRPETHWEIYLVGQMAACSWRQMRLRKMIAEHPDYSRMADLEYIGKCLARTLQRLNSQMRFEKTSRRRRHRAA